LVASCEKDGAGVWADAAIETVKKSETTSTAGMNRFVIGDELNKFSAKAKHRLFSHPWGSLALRLIRGPQPD
jgi:hypothetical protein